jgi:hypothetical protein
MRGANPDVWQPIIHANRVRLSVSERIEHGRRTGQTDAEIQDSLRFAGVTASRTREALNNLSYRWLEIDEAIEASARKLDSQKFVADYGLDTGFVDDFYKPYGKAIRVAGVNEDLARWKWALHWHIPGVAELREMFHRLRPGDVPKELEFTANDYQRWIGTQATLPYFNQRINAISYVPMPIRIMRVALTAGELPQHRVKGILQDHGHSPSDSEAMAKAEIILANQQVASKSKGWSIQSASGLIASGAITLQQATEKLQGQGYTPKQLQDMADVALLERKVRDADKVRKTALEGYSKQAVASYEAGVIDASTAIASMVAAGHPIDAARTTIATAELRVKTQLVSSAVASLRRGYFAGEISRNELTTTLIASGITPSRAEQYITRWAFQLTFTRKVASTGDIVKWIKEGHLSAVVGRQRLLNLGWQQPDVMLMIAEAEHALAAMQTKQQQLAAKAESGRVKQLVQLQKQQQTALKQTQSLIKQHSSPGKLVSWYAKHIIDETLFRSRLSAMGYDLPDIEGMFREATLARESLDAKTQKSGATGREYIGPGAT